MLDRVITLVLVLRHLIGNRSIMKCKFIALTSTVQNFSRSDAERFLSAKQTGITQDFDTRMTVNMFYMKSRVNSKPV